MNFILKTDSYKLTHWDMYPAEVTNVYSYLEARTGGIYEKIKWFGLQYYLKMLEGQVFEEKDINEAETFCNFHFGRKGQFNRRMWEHILRTYGGRLPIRILSAPEGLVIPTSNVLMTVENTDEKCPSLTNAIESLLMKVWYPTTVATVSLHVREMLDRYLKEFGDDAENANFMLHDFGYRGVSSEESAILGGMGHLLNFLGTDTVPAILGAVETYGARLDNLAFSVAASEHSIMTINGVKGEIDRARKIIASHPNQIVSLVADSYDYYSFVEAMCKEQELVNANKVKLVIRPDSVTKEHPTPQSLVLWTLNFLKANLKGVSRNSRGATVLPYGVLWGDGIEPEGIEEIVKTATFSGFSPVNLVFGMGGGLLQKVNRDTCRFAFKCSAMKANGEWFDVQKMPLDKSKASKAGRLQLGYSKEDGYITLKDDPKNLITVGGLKPVFENGVILHQSTWDEVRKRS